MNYIDFYQAFKNFTLFSIQDIQKSFPGFDRKILVDWQKKGYLLKVRNSWYCLAEFSIQESDLFFIANKIYSPSYISLESAFSLYGLIPEGVFKITSVSTLKTTSFDTPIGVFNYRNFKPSLMWGYTLKKQINHDLKGWYKVATPEKAILDFLYLNPGYNDLEDLEGLRFNWIQLHDQIDVARLEYLAKYFDSKALLDRLENLLKLFYAHS